MRRSGSNSFAIAWGSDARRPRPEIRTSVRAEPRPIAGESAAAWPRAPDRAGRPRLQQAVERRLERLPHHLARVGANLLLLDPNHALKVRDACRSCCPSGSPFVLVGSL